ncbi:hypothetical protein CFC21_055464 [Triticum aestivum]|uniref:Pectinesterase inhibitor domain-containing protein n=3 Tax=Triticum aestivum TaxID=4565 RepID=A0A3B6I4G6_WHEAT|nr:hypothetical protein CFC21_055464 [Triticum aestivum]
MWIYISVHIVSGILIIWMSQEPYKAYNTISAILAAMATARATAAFSSVAIMLLFVCVGAHAGGRGDKVKVVDLVVETCKNASSSCRNKHLNVTQEFCVQTLRSDKRSSKAKDLRDLSLVAVDILKIRVAAAGGKVKEALQKAKKGTDEALGLRYCQVDYDAAIGTLGLCDAMLRDFHVPRGDADGPWSFELPECVEKATDHVSDCWHDLHMDSQTLINENEELIKLGDLNNVLLGPYDFDS